MVKALPLDFLALVRGSSSYGGSRPFRREWPLGRPLGPGRGSPDLVHRAALKLLTALPAQQARWSGQVSIDLRLPPIIIVLAGLIQL
jgi:hypothetical protein